MSPSASSNTYSMARSDGDPGRPAGDTQLQTDRAFDRHQNSVEDYSRIMLEYTQRRMARFADTGDKGYATSHSSRGSSTSGQSGNSISGFLARQAAGCDPSRVRHDSAGAVKADSASAV